MSAGNVQIWPAAPVAEPLLDAGRVAGIRLMDQGTEKDGHPQQGFTPGMDIHAALTVVGDGPVGAVGQRLDEAFGLPEGGSRREWALGMKIVLDLPEGTDLQPGTVFHTIGYPEPEIFGFLYVHPGGIASVGIFVPSWFDNPDAHRVALFAALHAASVPVAISSWRATAVVGCEIAAGIRPSR